MGELRAPAGERTKVVYVIGAGHSGSTILGLTLGNCDGVFFAGEVARWLRYDGRPPLEREERAELWRRAPQQNEHAPELLLPRAPGPVDTGRPVAAHAWPHRPHRPPRHQ